MSTATETLDARGLNCPLPILRATLEESKRSS